MAALGAESGNPDKAARADSARAALAGLPDSSPKAALLALSDLVVVRSG